MRQSPAPASTVSRLMLPRLVRMAGESGIIPRRCAAATPFRFAPLRSPSQPRWSLWGSRHAGEAHTRTAPQATAWSDYRRAPPGYAPRLATQGGKTNGAKPGSGFYGFPAAAATACADGGGKRHHPAPLRCRHSVPLRSTPVAITAALELVGKPTRGRSPHTDSTAGNRLE